jgi:hypothetical protein
MLLTKVPTPNNTNSNSLTSISSFITFTQDAIAILTHSIGLSSAFAQAAKQLEQQALLKLRYGVIASSLSPNASNNNNDDGSLTIGFQIPKNEMESDQLRNSAVELYNIVRKGPQNCDSVLKLRILSCDAMYAAGISLKNDDGGIMDQLDTARAFAVSGVLALREFSTQKMGLRALKCALDIGGNGQDFIHKIGIVYGNSSNNNSSSSSTTEQSLSSKSSHRLLLLLPSTNQINVQEANEAASAQFGALVGYLSTMITASTSIPPPDGNNNHSIHYLIMYQELIMLATNMNQKILRDAVETGITGLISIGNYYEAKSWLELLCGNFEFLFANHGQRARTRAMLAICLCRLGNAPQAILILDNRGKHEMILESAATATTTTTTIENNWWWSEQVARIVIGLTLVQDEIHGGGNENHILMAKNKVLKDFEIMVMRYFSTHSSSSSNNNNNNGGVTIMETNAMLETAGNICTELNAFNESYGVILLQQYPNAATTTTATSTKSILFQTLIHAFEYGELSGRQGVLQFITSNSENIMNITTISMEEKYALTELQEIAWNEAEKYFAQEKWDHVHVLTRLVQQLLKINERFVGGGGGANDNKNSMKKKQAQCEIALALVNLHTQLPDPMGDVVKEQTILCEIQQQIDEAGQVAKDIQDSTIYSFAMLIKLRVLCRLSAITNTNFIVNDGGTNYPNNNNTSKMNLDKIQSLLASASTTTNNNTDCWQLLTMDAIRIATDAGGCGAHEAATLVLEFARNGLLLTNVIENSDHLLHKDSDNMLLLIIIITRITQRLLDSRTKTITANNNYNSAALFIEKITSDGTILVEYLNQPQQNTNIYNNDTIIRILDWIRCFLFNKAVSALEEETNTTTTVQNRDVTCIACMLELSARICELMDKNSSSKYNNKPTIEQQQQLDYIEEAFRARIVAASFLLDEAGKLCNSKHQYQQQPPVPVTVSTLGEMATACLDTAKSSYDVMIKNNNNNTTQMLCYRVGGLAILASIYTTVVSSTSVGTSNELDDVLVQRISEILEQYNVIESEILIHAAKICVEFQLFKCSRHICVNTIQAELSRVYPNYSIIGMAIIFMIQTSALYSSHQNLREQDIWELVDQFDTVLLKQATTHDECCSPETLEFGAITVWKLVENVLSLSLPFSIKIRGRVVDWLSLACQRNEEIHTTRMMELKGMMEILNQIRNMQEQQQLQQPQLQQPQLQQPQLQQPQLQCGSSSGSSTTSIQDITSPPIMIASPHVIENNNINSGNVIDNAKEVSNTNTITTSSTANTVSTVRKLILPESIQLLMLETEQNQLSSLLTVQDEMKSSENSMDIHPMNELNISQQKSSTSHCLREELEEEKITSTKRT